MLIKEKKQDVQTNGRSREHAQKSYKMEEWEAETL